MEGGYPQVFLPKAITDVNENQDHNKTSFIIIHEHDNLVLNTRM